MEELKQTVLLENQSPTLEATLKSHNLKSNFQRQYSNIKIEGLTQQVFQEETPAKLKLLEKIKNELSTATQNYLYTDPENVNYVVMLFDDEQEQDKRDQFEITPKSQRTQRLKNQSMQFITKDCLEKVPSMLTKEMRQSSDTFYNLRNMPLNLQKSKINFSICSNNNLNHISSPASSVNKAYGPSKGNTQTHKILPKSIKYLSRGGQGSPYTHQQTIPYNSSKSRMVPIVRNTSTFSKNRTMKAGDTIYNHREVLNRVSRFNLSEDEQLVYYQFAKVLSSFDENQMVELVESVIKDSKELFSSSSFIAIDQ